MFRAFASSRTRGRASRSRAARCGMASRLIRCRVDGVGGGTSSAKNSPPAKGTGGPVHLCAHKVVPAAAAHEMHLIEFLLPVSPPSLVGGLFCGQMSHGHNLRFKWLVPLGSLALMAWRERRGRGRVRSQNVLIAFFSPLLGAATSAFAGSEASCANELSQIQSAWVRARFQPSISQLHSLQVDPQCLETRFRRSRKLR